MTNTAAVAVNNDAIRTVVVRSLAKGQERRLTAVDHANGETAHCGDRHADV
jgi:hypothetical protein